MVTARVDAADVHTGALADRLQPFEDGDVLPGVLALSHYSLLSGLSLAVAPDSCGAAGGGVTMRSTRSLRGHTCRPLLPRGTRSFLNGRTSSVLPLSLSSTSGALIAKPITCALSSVLMTVTPRPGFASRLTSATSQMRTCESWVTTQSTPSSGAGC